MPLKLADAWQAPQVVSDHWKLPGQPAFSKSHAYELLVYDLQRYTLEEVSGRSFLIAGHRGAGKTSTVVQAVRHLRNEIINASTSVNTIRVGRRSKVQRPLLVKLIGQSLIEPPPKLESADPEAGQNSQGNDKKLREEASALVHMTIGLYRALATEYAEGFRNHALLYDSSPLADRLELAAQFELDLDTAPTPANLRPYWSLIDRLEDGILWPAESDTAFNKNKIYGRGLREVVAIVTAAQAFQVCSGAISYTETKKDVDNKEEVTKAGLDTKQLITRIGAMGAGALAGGLVGASEGPVPGVATGLLAWAFAGASLSWTGTRTRTRDRTLDYTFIRDSSIQTLDRDLPLVIERIRDAGLAPVFIIDELDKLQDKQAATITRLIRRLKHLVADYGFFCFLTGRDYFDVVSQKVANEIYPSEHTYFSERLLVINRPADLFHYLLSLVGISREGVATLPAAVFALATMYWAKLNFTDISREVSIVTGEDGALTCTDEELEAPGRFRLAATIQIAINRILARPEVSERMKEDPSFAQLALDSLYYMPRSWDANSDALVDVTVEALRTYLVGRMGREKSCDESDTDQQEHEEGGAEGDQLDADGQGPTGAKADPKTGVAIPPEPYISPPDIRDLFDMVVLLASYLSDFAMLRKELEDEANAIESTRLTDARNLRVLAQVVVAEKGRLIEPAPPRPMTVAAGPVP